MRSRGGKNHQTKERRVPRRSGCTLSYRANQTSTGWKSTYDQGSKTPDRNLPWIWKYWDDFHLLWSWKGMSRWYHRSEVRWEKMMDDNPSTRACLRQKYWGNAPLSKRVNQDYFLRVSWIRSSGYRESENLNCPEKYPDTNMDDWWTRSSILRPVNEDIFPNSDGHFRPIEFMRKSSGANGF